LLAAASALVALAVLPTTPQYWHLLYVMPTALVPLTIYVDRAFGDAKRRARTWRWIIVYAAYFSVFNLLGAIESRKHSWRRPLQQSYLEMCQATCELKTEL
jgi:phosphoglycerol transferase MdoB-like AlkP superfamily enzyme